jgi:hypothetical protein
MKGLKNNNQEKYNCVSLYRENRECVKWVGLFSFCTSILVFFVTIYKYNAIFMGSLTKISLASYFLCALGLSGVRI